MSEPRKKKKDTHTVKAVNLRLPPSLDQAVREASIRQAATVNEILRRALREHLEREGFWPVPLDKPAATQQDRKPRNTT